jgi:hypothetical protein
MDALHSSPRLGVSPAERAHLERAHEELCTALTALRSNVELARIELRHVDAPESRGSAAIAHLAEVETAVARLEGLAREMRAWHDGSVR